MQLKRFHERRHDPFKHWKITDIDLAAIDKWDDYTQRAGRHVPLHEHADRAVDGDPRQRPAARAARGDPRRARPLDYDGKDDERVGKPDPLIVGSGPEFFDDGLRRQPVLHAISATRQASGDDTGVSAPEQRARERGGERAQARPAETSRPPYCASTKPALWRRSASATGAASPCAASTVSSAGLVVCRRTQEPRLALEPGELVSRRSPTSISFTSPPAARGKPLAPP